MENSENRPFYRTENGFGVFLEGSCGLNIRDISYNGKDFSCLTIIPLKNKREPGTSYEDNDLMNDQGFLELAFASEKSVDALIEMLHQMKEICFNKLTV